MSVNALNVSPLTHLSATFKCYGPLTKVTVISVSSIYTATPSFSEYYAQVFLDNVLSNMDKASCSRAQHLVLDGVEPADLLTHNLESDAFPLHHSAPQCQCMFSPLSCCLRFYAFMGKDYLRLLSDLPISN